MYEWGYSTIFLHLKYGSLSGFELTCCVCGLIQFRSKEFQTTKGSLRISCILGYWRIIRLKMVQVFLQALEKLIQGQGSGSNPAAAEVNHLSLFIEFHSGLTKLILSVLDLLNRGALVPLATAVLFLQPYKLCKTLTLYCGTHN